MLPDHLIHELRYLEVYTGRRFPSLRSGAYRSRLRGPGFDFDEHRGYRAGDDVRRIDWNVTARLNSPYVRETHADRELNVVIAVDISPSMDFGTTRYSKREVQLLIAGCLVFSALADQMNIGFLAFSDRVLSYHPPRRTRSHAWRFLEELWSLQADGAGTQLQPAVRHLDSHFSREGLVFLLSDFLIDEETVLDSRDLKMLALRHDVIAVIIEDPAERELPAGGAALELRDVETGARRRIDLGAAQRRRYAAAMRARRRRLAEAFYRVPMDHVFVQTDRRALEPLLDLFALRRRA